MPTGRCEFPAHHSGPSAGAPLGLVAAIALGAIVIANVHALIVTAIVVAILILAAGGVVMLWHAGHSEPYDSHQDTVADVEQRITAQVGQAMLAARLEQLERDSVRDRVTALETQQAARAEVERAVVLHAIDQHQKQLDQLAAPVDERQAIAADSWWPDQVQR